MKSKQLGWVRQFMYWLFGAPFQELPSEFGDLVPPELRAFQVQGEEAQHRPQSRVTPSSKKAKPPR